MESSFTEICFPVWFLRSWLKRNIDNSVFASMRRYELKTVETHCAHKKKKKKKLDILQLPKKKLDYNFWTMRFFSHNYECIYIFLLLLFVNAVGFSRKRCWPTFLYSPISSDWALNLGHFGSLNAANSRWWVSPGCVAESAGGSSYLSLQGGMQYHFPWWCIIYFMGQLRNTGFVTRCKHVILWLTVQLTTPCV